MAHKQGNSRSTFAGFIHNPIFEEASERAAILADMPNKGNARMRKAPPGTPLNLRHLWEAPLLTSEQERHLFRKLNYLRYTALKLTDGRSQRRRERLLAEANVVRNQITEANLRLVVNMARKQLARVTRSARWYTFQFDEHELNRLVSDGNMYLMHAVDRFDYARGYKFSTYACSAMKKNFSRDIQKSNRDSMRCFNNQEEWFDGVDEGGNESQQTARAEQAQTYVTELLGKLDEREAAIIRMRNFEEMTLEEVGRHYGITKERVRQIEAKAMAKLRHVADENQVEM